MEKEKLTQEQVWNEIARPWQEFRKKPLKEVIEFLKNKKGKILDLGCGSGRHILKLKEVEFYGVDFSEEMLKLAEKDAKRKKVKAIFKKAEADRLPFKNNFFDSAICIATLHCIEKAKKREKVLKELRRVLKKNKEALITVWSRNHERIKNKPKEAKIPWTKEGKKYYRYYYIYEKEELKSLLKKIGFKILKIWENKNINVIVKKII